MGEIGKTIGKEEAKGKWVPDRLKQLENILTDLRHMEENRGKDSKTIVCVGGIYRAIDPTEVLTVNWDGWNIGYKLRNKENNGNVVVRTIYIKCEQPFKTIPKIEKDNVVACALDVLIDQGQGMPFVALIASDCLKITQEFVPLYLVEKSPRLTTIVGGVNA